MLRRVLAFIVLIAFAASSASAQAPGGRLKAIAASKTIRIAYRTDAAPFSFIDEKKTGVGYTIDICQKVVESLTRQLKIESLKVNWIPVTTQTRFELVAKGKADLECGASSVTLARMKEVDFSNYIFVESTGLAVRIASGVNNLSDMSGKIIAVIAGTSNEQAVLAKNQQSPLNAVVVPVKNRDEAIAALAEGRVDAFASDKLLLVGTAFKDAKALRMLPDDLSVEPYALVLPRGDWAMRLAVNTALADIFKSGEIMKIFDRWFSPIGLRPGLLLGATYALGALPE
jgi:glutamate/aspartate transport system substrate-binding protein